MKTFIVFLLFSLLGPSSVLAQEIQLNFQKNQVRGFFQSQKLMVDAEEYNTIIIDLQSDKSGTARLFWGNNYDQKFNQAKSIWFNIKAGRKTYYFNVPSQNKNWLGWITGLIIYPEITGAQMKIINAKIDQGSITNKLFSGWQEFWGPTGRLIIGSTINNYQTSRLFGLPFKLYLYIIVGLVLVLGFILKKNPRITIIAALACWVIINFNNTINQINYLKQEVKTYGGKSLEEKRAIATDPNLYRFLMFAKNNLPARAKVKSLINHVYGGKADYYLYPFDFSPGQADYIMVYNQEKKMSELIKENPGFKFYKKLTDKAYILKRSKK